jgi:hypothetical protein
MCVLFLVMTGLNLTEVIGLYLFLPLVSVGSIDRTVCISVSMSFFSFRSSISRYLSISLSLFFCTRSYVSASPYIPLSTFFSFVPDILACLALSLYLCTIASLFLTFQNTFFPFTYLVFLFFFFLFSAPFHVLFLFSFWLK